MIPLTKSQSEIIREKLVKISDQRKLIFLDVAIFENEKTAKI
jgi:hypothetical protein